LLSHEDSWATITFHKNAGFLARRPSNNVAEK